MSRLLFLTLLLLAFAAPSWASTALTARNNGRPPVGLTQSDTTTIPGDSIRDAADRVMKQHDYRSVRRRMLEHIPDKSDADGGFLIKLLGSIGEAIGDFLEWIFTGLFSPRNTVPVVSTLSATYSANHSSGMDPASELMRWFRLKPVATWVKKLRSGKRSPAICSITN